jgi:hypothetical protein
MQGNAPGETPQPKPNPLTAIRTYKSDVANSLKEKDFSLVDIALSEHQKKQSEPIVEVKKNPYILPLILTLVLGAALFFIIIYMIQQRGTTSTPPISANDIILTENEKIIRLTATDTPSKKIRGIASSLIVPADTVVRLRFLEATTTKQKVTIPIGNIVGTMGSPSYLTRSLTSQYVFGYHFHHDKITPFIILKGTSYETTASGMLVWETTLTKDFQTFFSLMATSSTTQNGSFQDALIKNHDVRIARNKKGQAVLLYSIPDKETIVITSDEETLIEMLNRLKTSQTM